MRTRHSLGTTGASFQSRLGCSVLVLLWPVIGWSAFVTTNQSDMNQIFSQPSFAGTPIDIRFQPTVTISNGSLLSIDNLAELSTLFALSPVPPPGINMFFVDAVNVCNIPDPLPIIVGCADIGGNAMVVASNAAADTAPVNTIGTVVTGGAILNAHELAHNLGLSHTAECTPSMPPNLMDCQLLGAELTVGQVQTILASGLLQTGPMGLFVDITPIVIVPIPAAASLFGSALCLLGWLRHRHE